MRCAIILAVCAAAWCFAIALLRRSRFDRLIRFPPSLARECCASVYGARRVRERHGGAARRDGWLRPPCWLRCRLSRDECAGQSLSHLPSPTTSSLPSPLSSLPFPLLPPLSSLLSTNSHLLSPQLVSSHPVLLTTHTHTRTRTRSTSTLRAATTTKPSSATRRSSSCARHANRPCARHTTAHPIASPPTRPAHW
jgi:hypothetical protein